MVRENLIRLRKAKKLTQTELASNIGITVRHYQALEYGNSKGSMEVWEKLRDLLGKPIDYLYENTN